MTWCPSAAHCCVTAHCARAAAAADHSLRHIAKTLFRELTAALCIVAKLNGFLPTSTFYEWALRRKNAILKRLPIRHFF